MLLGRVTSKSNQNLTLCSFWLKSSNSGDKSKTQIVWLRTSYLAKQPPSREINRYCLFQTWAPFESSRLCWRKPHKNNEYSNFSIRVSRSIFKESIEIWLEITWSKGKVMSSKYWQKDEYQVLQLQIWIVIYKSRIWKKYCSSTGRKWSEITASTLGSDN